MVNLKTSDFLLRPKLETHYLTLDEVGTITTSPRYFTANQILVEYLPTLNGSSISPEIRRDIYLILQSI